MNWLSARWIAKRQRESLPAAAMWHFRQKTRPWSMLFTRRPWRTAAPATGNPDIARIIPTPAAPLCWIRTATALKLFIMGPPGAARRPLKSLFEPCDRRKHGGGAFQIPVAALIYEPKDQALKLDAGPFQQSSGL